MVHIHVVGGEATRAATLTLMRVSTLVRPSPRAAVGRSAAGRFLEGSLGGLTLRQRSHTLRRCMATDAACCVALPGA